MTAAPGGSAHDELVSLLRAAPLMLRRFMQDHAPDASGHCRTCRAGGDGSGRVRDCRLWAAACAASRADRPQG